MSRLGIVIFEVSGPLTFERWMELVDAEVAKITMLGAEDFADWDYAGAFEDAIEPRQAAVDMLAADGIGVQFLEKAGIEHEASF